MFFHRCKTLGKTLGTHLFVCYNSNMIYEYIRHLTIIWSSEIFNTETFRQPWLFRGNFDWGLGKNEWSARPQKSVRGALLIGKYRKKDLEIELIKEFGGADEDECEAVAEKNAVDSRISGILCWRKPRFLTDCNCKFVKDSWQAKER